MAKQQPQRPGEGLTLDQQAALVRLGTLMGDPRDDFDHEVEAELAMLKNAEASRTKKAYD